MSQVPSSSWEPEPRILLDSPTRLGRACALGLPQASPGAPWPLRPLPLPSAPEPREGLETPGPPPHLLATCLTLRIDGHPLLRVPAALPQERPPGERARSPRAPRPLCATNGGGVGPAATGAGLNPGSPTRRPPLGGRCASSYECWDLWTSVFPKWD